MGKIKDYLIVGVAALLPLVVTIWLIWYIFSRLAGTLSGASQYVGLNTYYASIPYFGRLLDLVDELVILLLIILLAGFIVSRPTGKSVLLGFERAVSKVPIVRAIYMALRHGTDSFITHKREFKRVCLIEFPRRDCFALGFVTNEGFVGGGSSPREEMYTIYIPTSPMPVTGFTTIQPKRDVKILDIPVEDALKMIVSAGFLTPEDISGKKMQQEILTRVHQKVRERLEKRKDGED